MIATFEFLKQGHGAGFTRQIEQAILRGCGSGWAPTGSDPWVGLRRCLRAKGVNFRSELLFAHVETSLGKGKVSISSVAVEFAEKIFQDFTGKTVLVVGAGEMCELLIKHLYEEGARTFVVANRTFERAQNWPTRIRDRPSNTNCSANILLKRILSSARPRPPLRNSRRSG